MKEQLMSPQKIELLLLNPKGEIEAKKMFAPAARIPDLAGKRIALVSNTKPGARTFLDAVEGLLKSRYPTASFLKQFDTTVNLAMKPEFYDEVAQSADAFILGSGD
jgi:hypothetical protein